MGPEKRGETALVQNNSYHEVAPSDTIWYRSLAWRITEPEIIVSDRFGRILTGPVPVTENVNPDPAAKVLALGRVIEYPELPDNSIIFPEL